MNMESKVGNCPPADEEFLEMFFSHTIEGNWMSLLYMTIFALKVTYEAKGWSLSEDETEEIKFAIHLLSENYRSSIEAQN